MAFDYAYFPDDSLIVLTGSGLVTTADRIDCVQRMFKDQGLPGKVTVLIDVCRVANPPGENELLFIGILLKRLQSRFRSRIAIVNSTVGHLTFSHLIAFSTETDKETVNAFDSEKEARQWLG